MDGIKIFKMNYCDWVAATTIEEATQCLADHVGDGVVDNKFIDDYDVEATEITEKQYETLKFIESDGPDEFDVDNPKSFREKLNEMVKKGEKFPQFFASTEY